MYTIVVNQNNVLEKTHIERIMRKSKLVNNLRFLVPIQYNEINMDGFTAVLEYRLPITKDYAIEILTVQSELYADEYLDYRLPVDTKLTAEPGEVGTLRGNVSDNRQNVFESAYELVYVVRKRGD